MKTIVFLCSGGGGNFRFIKRSIDLGVLKSVSLAAVIADRDCPALRLAERERVAGHLVPYSQKKGAELYDLLDRISPDLIVTTIHKILDHRIVSRFQGKLVNLHYSLLPAFKGLIGAEPLKQALQLGSRIIGTTAHHVTEEVDAGRIISQSAFAVDPAASFEGLLDRLFRSGCVNLANAIDILVSPNSDPHSGAGFVHNQSMLVSPPPRFTTDVMDDAFWESLR